MNKIVTHYLIPVLSLYKREGGGEISSMDLFLSVIDVIRMSD